MRYILGTDRSLGAPPHPEACLFNPATLPRLARMTNPANILYMLDLNETALQKLLPGLTADDALLQPPTGGNCLNWVMGHIVEGRNYMLELLDEPRIWSETECAPYATRSAPISGPEAAHYAWGTILAAADDSLIRVRAKLLTLSQVDLPDGEDSGLGALLVRMAWHEGYHAGQVEYLRQLAGKADHAL